MRFILEIDMTQGELPADPADELGRILRYWAGNLKHYQLASGTNEVVYDSAYAPVGTWRMTDD